MSCGVVWCGVDVMCVYVICDVCVCNVMCVYVMCVYVYIINLVMFQEHINKLALPSIEDQAAIEQNKATVDTWQYKPNNAVMYVPDGKCVIQIKQCPHVCSLLLIEKWQQQVSSLAI